MLAKQGAKYKFTTDLLACCASLQQKL